MIMMIQSWKLRPQTLKNCCRPGNSTMTTCPTKMMATMVSNTLQPLKWSALRPVSKARAQKR